MHTTPAFLGVPTALEHDDLTSLIEILFRLSETFFCLSVSALGEWRCKRRISVTARADYAAAQQASSNAGVFSARLSPAFRLPVSAGITVPEPSSALSH
jgi:hypothetical protein